MIKYLYNLIKKIWNYFFQFEFIRFGFVGFLNTVIDYVLMNILMFVFQVWQGFGFVLIKIFSISVSIIFSYFMNLIITFKLKKTSSDQLFKFVILSVITLLVNVWIASYLVDHVKLPLNKYLWANISSFLGAIIAIAMRYFGSRIIFKKIK